MSDELKASFAWTPSKAEADYEYYPPYVNLTGNRLTVRGYEKRGKGHVQPGDCVSVELADEALSELAATLASRTPTEAIEPGEAEVTDAMVQAGRDAWCRDPCNADDEAVKRIYRAMRAAALRSTTPASDECDDDLPTAEDVRGILRDETPVSVAVDDDALVKRLRGFAAAMRKHDPRLVSAGYGRFSFSPAEYEAIADRLQSLQASIRVKDEALRWIEGGAKLGTEMFEQRVRERKDRLTWWAVNVLQDNLAACQGTAKAALSDQQQGDEG